MKRIASGSGLLALALLLGTITAVSAMTWLSRAGEMQVQSSAASERLRPAVVAKIDAAAGTRLTAAMLDVRDTPEAMILTGTPSTVDAVAGRLLRYPVVAGEQLSAQKLVSDGPAGAGLAFAVPQGLRGVAVAVTEVSGAGGLIVPGDRVDVLLHTQYDRLFGPTDVKAVDPNLKQRPIVLTVLQDLLVIAVAQETTPPIDEQRDTATLRPDDAKPQPTAKSVTLAVTPAQAQALFLAAHEGAVGLALRPFGDTSSSTLTPVVRLEALGAELATSGSVAARN